ncbi:MAG: hypothetical protein RL020_1707, partial [Pseudomonadota bacterium]
ILLDSRLRGNDGEIMVPCVLPMLHLNGHALGRGVHTSSRAAPTRRKKAGCSLRGLFFGGWNPPYEKKRHPKVPFDLILLYFAEAI